MPDWFWRPPQSAASFISGLNSARHFSARRGRLLRAALARYGFSDSDHGANAPCHVPLRPRSGGNGPSL